MLSAALIHVNGLIENLEIKNAEQSSLAERSLALLTESYDELRSISHQMMPNALLKSGLATAIREFISKIDQQKLKVSLEMVGLNEKLDENTETVIYRVIQEATSNVMKHAQASKLSIQLIYDEDGVNLSIEDNGTGFEQETLKNKEGIGLKNIQNRVQSLKGTVEFDSRPGEGTLITIHLPA
jgi:two-component system NarL family sensor kinase